MHIGCKAFARYMSNEKVSFVACTLILLIELIEMFLGLCLCSPVYGPIDIFFDDSVLWCPVLDIFSSRSLSQKFTKNRCILFYLLILSSLTFSETGNT